MSTAIVNVPVNKQSRQTHGTHVPSANRSTGGNTKLPASGQQYPQKA
jgi:hypothetical protein